MRWEREPVRGLRRPSLGLIMELVEEGELRSDARAEANEAGGQCGPVAAGGTAMGPAIVLDDCSAAMCSSKGGQKGNRK